MENPIEGKFSELTGQLKSLLDTRINLLKINLAEKISRIIYLLVFGIIILAVSVICLTFFSITLALWLSVILKSNTLGFLIVAFFYLVITIIVFILRKKIILAPILRNILSIFYADQDDENK